MGNYDFAADIAECNKIAQGSPAGLCAAGIFAALTIRVKFHQVPAMAESLRESDTALWGIKRLAHDYLLDNYTRVYSRSMGAVHLSQDPTHAYHDVGAQRGVMDVLTRVPGLGVVKAGFVAQLAFGIVGCIDTHNAARYAVPRAVIRDIPAIATDKARAIRIDRYVSLCESIGGSELIWGEWCQLIADRYPQQFADAGAVSRVHAQCMVRLRDYVRCRPTLKMGGID